MLLAEAFSQAAAPFFAAAATGRAAARLLIRAAWIPALGLISALALVGLAPFVVDNLLGDAYSQSAEVLQVLAVATTLVLFNQPLATLLQARGLDRAVGLGMLTMAVVQTVGVIVLAQTGGALAAAFAYLVGQ